MERFHVIDEAVVILRIKGVYRQVKAYRRGAGLYAGYGSGFIRLYGGDGTSAPNVSYDGFDGFPNTRIDKMGRLEIIE